MRKLKRCPTKKRKERGSRGRRRPVGLYVRHCRLGGGVFFVYFFSVSSDWWIACSSLESVVWITVLELRGECELLSGRARNGTGGGGKTGHQDYGKVEQLITLGRGGRVYALLSRDDGWLIENTTTTLVNRTDNFLFCFLCIQLSIRHWYWPGLQGTNRGTRRGRGNWGRRRLKL